MSRTIVAIASLLLSCALAHADQCETLRQQYEQLLLKNVSVFAHDNPVVGTNQQHCDFGKQHVGRLENEIALQMRVERVCGSRLHQQCDSRCRSQDLAETRRLAQEACNAPPKVDEARFDDACAMVVAGLVTDDLTPTFDRDVAMCANHPVGWSCEGAREYIRDHGKVIPPALTCRNKPVGPRVVIPRAPAPVDTPFEDACDLAAAGAITGEHQPTYDQDIATCSRSPDKGLCNPPADTSRGETRLYRPS